jgi:hypothetical protein
VVGLIRAKEKEHEDAKLVGNDRELMDSAALKWSKITAFVHSLQVSDHYRGPQACKDKWNTLYGDYKKVKDYMGATGNSEDYFQISSKRRKELTFPACFWQSQFNEMDHFLKERPCLNLPYQRDLLDDSDHPFLGEDYDSVEGPEDNDSVTPELSHTPESLVREGIFTTAGGRSGQHPSIHEVGGCSTTKSASKGKEKAVSDKRLADFIKKHFPKEQEGSPMECDARPPNTAMKRRQSSNQTKMVEVT